MAQQGVKGIARLRILAGKASPSPAIGQALGPLGVNMMEFCKQFNDKSSHFIQGVPIPVVLTAMHDRSFSFYLKTPPTAWFLKKASGLEKGNSLAGNSDDVATIGLGQIIEIAKIKQQDAHLRYIDLEPLSKSIIGTAKSMGIQVV